jgi:hypothetical protein
MNYLKKIAANPKPIEKANDPILRGVTAALKRAAKRARMEAARTGTCIIIWRNNKIVRISPKPQSGSTKP